jgi:hypothetical protein
MAMIRDIGYVPVLWSRVGKYARSNSMRRILGMPVTVPTCDADRLGCMTTEEILAMVEPSTILDIFDKALREGLNDVLDTIIMEHGWPEGSTILDAPELEILRSVPHDTMLWLSNHDMWQPPDLVHAVIYDQPEYLYDDIVNIEAIHAILMYDRIDMYNTYKEQVDKYVADNPESILMAGPTIMDIILRVPTIARNTIPLPMTPEMADIVMVSYDILGTLVDRSMIGIIDKYATTSDLRAIKAGDRLSPIMREYIAHIL